MSLPTLLATATKLVLSPLVVDVEFLGTKVRAHMPNGYILDVYYNATLQKYSYTVIKHNKRIIGWDNAPHHKHVKTHPHHFHSLDGKVGQSKNERQPNKRHSNNPKRNKENPKTPTIVILKIVNTIKERA